MACVHACMLIRHLYDRKADLECEGEANPPAAALELQLEHQSDKSKAFSPLVPYENVKTRAENGKETATNFSNCGKLRGGEEASERVDLNAKNQHLCGCIQDERLGEFRMLQHKALI